MIAQQESSFLAEDTTYQDTPSLLHEDISADPLALLENNTEIPDLFTDNTVKNPP